MAFEFEEDLRSSFRTHAGPRDWWPRTTRTWNVAMYESTCSDGRADLVWATFGKDSYDEFSPHMPDLLQKPVCSRILSLLKPQSERTFRYLCSKTGVTERTIRTALADLEDAGLVRERAVDRYVFGDRFVLPQAFICSFEFKLKDWRRAVFQATRYRTFSHRVFVVMPTESIRPALKNITTFQALNIGLIGHDAHGVSNIEVLPRQERPRSRHHYIRAIGMLLPTSDSDTYLPA